MSVERGEGRRGGEKVLSIEKTVAEKIVDLESGGLEVEKRVV